MPSLGCILTGGPMTQMLIPQGGLQRKNSNADRWQHATSFQKGFIPSSHNPLPVIHKAKKGYEVGKFSDEEQSKRRQLKAILNKLTPKKFDKLFVQVKEVNIDYALAVTDELPKFNEEREQADTDRPKEDGYAQNGMGDDARQLFDKMPTTTLAWKILSCVWIPLCCPLFFLMNYRTKMEVAAKFGATY
eukprot:Gb_06799 [translate_table: standard]